ncbi:TPA: hypothetical protein ACJEU7_001841 [Acinetobacter baumannii]|uniref:hypothetical protein n=1 Tax=Acinetobacter baumannii TaxID=470 RepID=UPI00225904EF|nr:hypothetical protein [Acinetobacter baumannii]MCX3034032.1 hypothetical protein [Acinetobacter baumannii]
MFPSYQQNGFLSQPEDLNDYVKKIKTMDEKTVITYKKRWEWLLSSKRYCSNADTLPKKITSIIRNLEFYTTNSELRHSTYRQYRASVFFGLAATHILLTEDKIKETDLDDGLDFSFLEETYLALNAKNIAFNDAVITQKRTSAHKVKFFPYEFYEYLKKKANPEGKIFNTSKLTKLDMLYFFVEANLIVGLRPIEWLNAKIYSRIEDRCLVLSVSNAKNSNGRANGDQRELLLKKINIEELNAIMRFFILFHSELKKETTLFLQKQMNFTKSPVFRDLKNNDVLNYISANFEPTFMNLPLSEVVDKANGAKSGLASHYLNSLQKKMYFEYRLFCKEHNGDKEFKPTMYSTRHQCIANAKSAKVNRFEIAAFFGHVSIETSSIHYGKAWHGWSKFDFRPTLESILAVENSLPYLESEYSYKAESKPQLNIGDQGVEFTSTDHLFDLQDKNGNFDLG